MKRLTFGAVTWTCCGLAAMLLPLAACKPSATEKPSANTSTEDAADHDEHGHEHAHENGPHDGEIVELGGGEYHAELLHDHAAHKVTVYLLKEDATTAAPISTPELTVNIFAGDKASQYKLPAVNATKEGSSQFELVDEALCDAIDADGAKVRLNVMIGAQSFTGDVPSHNQHDHDGHKH